MDRNHEFTVGLPDGGQYEVALLSEVETVSQNGSTVLRLPWIGVDAKGDSEEEVLPQLLGGLQEKIGAGPGSPDFERFAEYVRSKGRRLSDEEVAGREEKRFKSQTLRSILTPDEHYEVQLFADAEVDRAGDRVTVRLPWIDVEGSGA
ncbi:MAG TPA: hypothetical protein VNE62_11895, partial [Actinomycetota bacterium]|nr:hypothetical protein [Actinomycetota bacterium]